MAIAIIVQEPLGNLTKGVQSSVWQQCHKLYLIFELATIVLAPLFFWLWRLFFSYKSGEWQKFSSNHVHIHLFTSKTATEMRGENA